MGWIRQKNVFDAPHPHAPFHAFVSFEFPVQLQAQTFRIRCCWDSFRFAECSKPCCCWCLQINFSRLTVTTACLRTVANTKLPGLFAVQLLFRVMPLWGIDAVTIRLSMLFFFLLLVVTKSNVEY